MQALPVISLPSIWLVVKIFFLIGISIYIVFAFVIVRQVDIMIATLDVGFKTRIKLLSYLHLLFAIGVLIVALITL